MIRLFDLSAEFWRNYFGSGSAITAYELTIDKLDWYWRDSKRMVVCCDSPTSFRRDLEPSYKANRKPRPRDAIDSLTSVEHRAGKWGVPMAQADGFEADDLIATLSRQAFPEDVLIIGDEKDFYALISDSVKLFGRKGQIGYSECVEKWGVEPAQMTEFLAIVGDASDNIQGCPGLGPQKAEQLLELFGSIEKAKAATDEQLLSLPKWGAKTLASWREWDPKQALSLVQLRYDAPVNLWDILPSESP